ncbi:hypothetical protein VNO77_08853 [Canavalia gladiata]|uniref:Uncharacterized protein n=1 Tax=Canavalia gladiata TaxID=3824 RepID=A0AAN9ME97_CANGL
MAYVSSNMGPRSIKLSSLFLSAWRSSCNTTRATGELLRFLQLQRTFLRDNEGISVAELVPYQRKRVTIPTLTSSRFHWTNFHEMRFHLAEAYLRKSLIMQNLVQLLVIRSIGQADVRIISMNQGIREVLLSEALSGLVSSLHLSEKPTDQHIGSATESACNWYIENIIEDVSGARISFVPTRKCFRSTRPVGGYFTELVTDLRGL